MKTLRIILPLILVVLSAANAAPDTAAIAPTSDKGGQTVNLEMNNLPVQDALAALFRGTGKSFAVEPGVAGTASISLQDVPFEEAVDATAKAWGLTYRINKGVYVFARVPKAEPYRHVLPQKTVTLFLSDTPIKNALETLFEDTNVAYVLEPGIAGTVTMRINDVPFSDALSAVLKASGLTVRKENGIDIFSTKTPAVLSVGAASPWGDKLDSDTPGKIEIKPIAGKTNHFDVTLERADLVEAVKELMSVAKTDYVLDMDLAAQITSKFAPRITAKISNATVDDALKLLSKASHLEVERSDSAYILRWRGGTSASVPLLHVGKVGSVLSVPRVEEKICKTCKECGESIQAGWKFCPKCGKEAKK